MQDIWDDIQPINSQAAERLGYPTQKPEALLERIITASSSTRAIASWTRSAAAAPRSPSPSSSTAAGSASTSRTAITLIKHPLGRHLQGYARGVQGHRRADDAARRRGAGAEDPYQFQWWALGLVGARPVEQKKGADKGIDGRLYLPRRTGQPDKQIILSVKAGNTGTRTSTSCAA